MSDANELADRLIAAIEAGNVEEVAALYADDAVIWHNDDGVEQTKEQNLRVLGWLIERTAVREYRAIRRYAIAGGFVQQHDLFVEFHDGRTATLPASLIVHLADGRITRLDEYLDGAAAAAAFRRVAPLHADVAILAPLLGTWEGAGRGEYPSIDDFGYVESVTFGHVGKPFLAYTQRTRAADDGRPLHAEAGYLRSPRNGAAELILAHPTGITELGEGSVEVTPNGLILTVRTTSIGRSQSAKEVTAVERVITVDGDELHYRLSMVAVGHPMTHHLDAHLRRTGAP